MTNDVNKSCEVRLNGKQWCAVGVLLVVLVLIGSALERQEIRNSTGEDDRIPYAQSEDYELFRQQTAVLEEEDIVVLGDSVVWGHYVRADESLTHYLNEKFFDGPGRFVNLGVEGLHPAAMAGLVRYYGGGLKGRKVIVHLNPLWLGGPGAQRRGTLEHERLGDLFAERSGPYCRWLSNRMGWFLERHVRLLSLAQHVRFELFDGMSISHWLIENPYHCPFKKRTLFRDRYFEPADKTEGIAFQSASEIIWQESWADVQASDAWRCFEEVLAKLSKNDCQIYILIGPLNEHWFEKESLARYRGVLGGIQKRLGKNGYASFCLPVLEAGLYADLSHPTAKGYEVLAERLLEDNEFQAFCQRGKPKKRGQSPFKKRGQSPF